MWRVWNGRVGSGFIVLCALAGACYTEAAVTAPSTLDCEAEFSKVMDDDLYPDLTKKIKRWASLDPHCAGTGLYELRLGSFYILANNNDKARKVLQEGLTQKTEYERDLRHALFDINFTEGFLESSEVEASGLVEDYPEWWGSYLALGQVRLLQKRYQEAIDNLEHANTLAPSSAAYSTLAMAYYQVNRYRQSAIAMQKALKLDQSALKYTQAVCATAYSLVAIGELAAAEDLLVKHLKVQPDARNDPTYQQAITTVNKKMQELGAAN